MSSPLRTGILGRPKTPAGVETSGRILRLLFGQAHGFIRLRNGREVFFHRADLKDAMTFNLLEVGDLVAFELIDDPISGARAIHVTQSPRR